MKRLSKSSHKIFDGVLGGFAEYLAVDPTWVRLGYVLFAIFVDPWTALWIYIAAMFLMPKSNVEVWSAKNTQQNIEDMKERFLSNKVIFVVGFGLILLGTIFLLEQLSGVSILWTIRSFIREIRTYLWPVILILVGLWVIFRARRS